MENIQCIIVFESAHYAIMAEKRLKNFDIKTIPTPREISTSCGISIVFQVEKKGEVLEEIASWDDYEDMLDIYELNKNTTDITKIEIIKNKN